jgi:thiamine kinase
MSTATRTSPLPEARAACPDRAALDAALASFADGRARLAGPLVVSFVRAGASNDSWRVRSADADWIVRVGRGADQRFVLDRQREAALARHAAAAGFAPGVVHTDADRALFVTAYVEGGSPDEACARSPEFAARVGHRLAELHALAWPLSREPLDLAALFGHYLSLDAPRHAPFQRDLVERVASHLLADYRAERVAFCHLDLHRENLLLGPPLRLIDWEYAALADPWLDLAAYASYEDLDVTAIAALLAGYGAGAPPSASRLEPRRALFDCLRVLWTDAAGAWGTVPAETVARLRARLLGADPRPPPARLPGDTRGRRPGTDP